MEFKNNKVSNIEKINGNEVTFEHDSSKEAWEHYKNIYFQSDGSSRISRIKGEYKLENENQLVLCNYKDEKYFNQPTEKETHANRYYLLSNNNTVQLNEEYDGKLKNLSGDCDFNFNDIKSPLFERMIKDEYKDYPRMKNYALNLLEECKKMHHTLLNFSLMQTKGNMNGFKGRCSLNNVNTYLDRPDTLVFNLVNYYKFPDEKEKSNILANAGANKKTLKEYLDSFDDIYDYCNKIYFIEDKAFVDRMIKEGCLCVNTGKDVIRYMLLALEFWDRKEVQIKKIYDCIK